MRALWTWQNLYNTLPGYRAGAKSRPGTAETATAVAGLRGQTRTLQPCGALNKQGTQVLERYAAIFLTKILGDDDPNYLDIRSPCGAGIGQLAYNHDGKIFTCDEGRMVHQMGDSFFQIGKVGETRYRQVMLSDTVRALTVASNLDAQPDCVACVYNPYCGVCPVHSYATQGSIFGRMRESSWCAVHKGIQDFLFEMLHDGDPETVETLRRWTTIRERAHFVQPRCSE